MLFAPCGCNHPPPPVPTFLLKQNPSPKDIAGSDIRYASLKLMPRFENPSVAGPEFRDKRKRGRPKRERGRSKRERGRYVSEAAPRFGNVCTNPAVFGRSLPILRNKLSDSRKKPSNFRKKPSGLRRSHAANAFRKGVPNRCINFKDTYRNEAESQNVK